MKKITKFLLCGAGLLAGQAFINELIYNCAANKDVDKTKNIYEWRFGKINYIVEGKGEPVLLIHNTLSGLGLHEWNKNINLLSKYYTVYAIDLLGYGYSDRPNITYSSYLYVSLINDFIKNVIQKPTNIIASGYSSSFGLLANSFSPEMIKKVIVVSPTSHSSNDLSTTMNKVAKFFREAPIVGDTIFNLKNSFLGIRILFDALIEEKENINKEILDEYYLAAHRKGKNNKFVISALESGYLNADIVTKLTNSDVPVHIIWGDDDEINPIANYNYLAENCPNISLTIFENAKSLPHLENPKDFTKVCKMFLSKI